jgi:hypothetical protein
MPQTPECLVISKVRRFCIAQKQKGVAGAMIEAPSWMAKKPDFSVVLFRSDCMLVSEEYPMKVHKNQWLLTMLSPSALPYGATNQRTHHDP